MLLAAASFGATVLVLGAGEQDGRDASSAAIERLEAPRARPAIHNLERASTLPGAPRRDSSRDERSGGATGQADVPGGQTTAPAQQPPSATTSPDSGSTPQDTSTETEPTKTTPDTKP